MSIEPETTTGPRPPSSRLGLLPMIIKLAMAIIGISSIALLRIFIEAGNLGSNRASCTESGVMWQVLIHLTFVVSAIGIVFVDRFSDAAARKKRSDDHAPALLAAAASCASAWCRHSWTFCATCAREIPVAARSLDTLFRVSSIVWLARLSVTSAVA